MPNPRPLRSTPRPLPLPLPLPLLLLALASFSLPAHAQDPASWEVQRIEDEALELFREGKPFLRYVYRDPVIRRPYFSQAHTPSGIRLTRNHPPVEGIDPGDHGDMHPGIWLAFGDINGHDFWRNGADIRHDKFIAEPEAGADGISFSVQNLYEAGGSTLCRDETSIRINSEKGAFVLQWDCRLIALDQALVFGDQEEMGLGFRVATPLAVRNGGQIRNADERVNEKEIWGKPSTWCDYTGQVDGRHAGIALLPHPENPRPSRFHARDYGLLVANPFALKAFGEPDSDPVRVNAGESLRLRFQVVLHDGEWDPPGGGAEPRQQ